MSTTTHVRTCPLCEATCGLEITLTDGEVTRIRGDRDDVFSKGFICPKGSTLKQLHADPDRLRTPMVRRDGELRPATWDEAFAAVAEGLGRVLADGDRDAVAVYLGNPNVHSMAGTVMNGPLLRALGSRNLYTASTVDQMPRHVSSGYLFGSPGAIPVPDLDRTDYLLMLGANPHESNGSMCTAPDFPGRMAAIRERGGKVVTVDPRRTKTAVASDEHIAIRPGTDALWLAALVTEIDRAGLVDLGPATGHVDGLADVLAALAPFTAESVEAHTRVPADVTRRIAHEVATAPAAAVYGRVGAHTTAFGTTASWLTEVVNIVTGNLDRPGGVMFPAVAIGAPTEGRTPGGRGFTTGRWTSRVRQLPEVRGELPVATLADEIETPGPGQVRALITSAGNPVRSCPDSDRLDAAIASLEFMVSIDMYVNETTRHADVILPVPSALAKPHFDFSLYGLAVRNVANYSPPIHAATDPSEPGLGEHEILARLTLVAQGVEPTEAAAADLIRSTLAALAERAGLDADEALAARSEMHPLEVALDLMLVRGPYPGLDVTRLLAEPHGVDLGPLEPRLPGLLRTVSGTVELAAAPLVGDVTRLRAELDRPVGDELLLVGRRHLRSNNSWMHNVPVLVRGKARCTLQVHPDDAGRLGLVDGDRALVRAAVGEVVADVEVTDELSLGTVSLPHGWGHDVAGVRMAVAAAAGGVNSNVLTDGEVIDPLSGNARLNAIPVSVAPVPETVAAAGD